MEPEPVEECVQSTLAALYPPFEATAPTLLSQVFEVLERTYQHDALRYTLDFLVPAKHILARIQSEACAQYSGFVFCHEGWPLCLHEKVLVQLGSLPWQHLSPGDFYLQVVPHRECAPRLVLKCLSLESRGVQELPVSPDSYRFLFTIEWLNGINKERRVGRLERCLLAAGEKVLSLPWAELVYPQFVHKDGFIVGQHCPTDLTPEILGARSPGDGRHSGGENRESEGEYVHLLEVSPTLHQAPRIPQPCTAQIQTMPARKGHSKNRNRRHRAWLHHKSGCGENFALRQACKTEEAEKSSQEKGNQDEKVAQLRSNPSPALDPVLESPGSVGNLNLKQLEENLDPLETKPSPILSSSDAVAEDTVLGKEEFLESVYRDPTPPKEESKESLSPALATPKRTTKGNRRKKKGAGKGAGGRVKQGSDSANQETESSDLKTGAEKEEAFTGPGEQDSGTVYVSTRDPDSIKVSCVDITECDDAPECDDTQEKGSTAGNQSFETGVEGANNADLAVSIGDCIASATEPEDSKGKCTIGDNEGSSGEGNTEDPKLNTEEPNAKPKTSEPRIDTEEVSVQEKEVEISEDQCMVEQRLDSKEPGLTDLPSKNELASVDGKEETVDIAADQGPGEIQNSLLPTVARLGESVNWNLLQSGVFALTGGIDKAGHSLLTIVPQPLQDELPPGQEDLVNTLRYMHSLLRQELKILGLTVLLDLSHVDDWAFQAPVLLPALRAFQETTPTPISQLLVILPSDDRFVPHEEELTLEPAVEIRLLLLHELPHYVALDQLTPALGGTLSYSPPKWVREHQALEQLQDLCCGVLQTVCEASDHLNAVGTASSQEELSTQIALHQDTMQKLLSEPRLLELQRRGGSLLARLPPSGPCSNQAVDATRLYQEVDEALHGLVQLSNRCLELLQQEKKNLQVQQEGKTCLLSSDSSVEKKRGGQRPAEGLAEGTSLEKKLLQYPRSSGKSQVTPKDSSVPRARACSISASSSPKHGLLLGAKFGSSCSLTSLFQPLTSPKGSPRCSPGRSNALDSRKKSQGPLSTSKTPASPANNLALRALSDPGRPSVHIRGLEVSSRELADRSCSPREHVLLGRSRTHVAEAPWGATPRMERRRCLGVQQQLLVELLECEREYVGALTQPFSLSQELGGHAWTAELRCLGSALRATRDRLLAFHSSCLLSELEGCMSHPSRAGSCFLRHREELQLYAIYAKDHHKFHAALALLRSTGKKGLMEPREDGQIAHTLQVPLEQLERYRRFLGELLHECELEQGPDRQTLQEAQQLLESQEQRGRDLLAIEQIRGCEMRLSEQGTLLQRGELILLSGRRKCQRHVFLFEQLLLFTKCKGAEGGYVCKQALQTASMGLTESVGSSGLRFELWFGRGSSRQAYTLQAASAEVKHQWTNIIAQLLWRQAAQPSVSMSLSSCPSQRLAPLGLGPGPPPGLSLPGHFEEEEWDLDVKPIPRAHTSGSEGTSPSHHEPLRQGRSSLPGSSSALGQHQSSFGIADEPVTPL
ncbi:PREDICTED: rho guanine nucleotide exchange factor 40-like isoform X3 [Thamnophis sirtalis]|uniref:Rho guanine nucleotide exchange factor 40-like isoform X3 n=2 Tax=Thamnophis sirtalis TaxID=35019 RepID=A0A6I9YGB7_9SAUR|nr:PREDICTED: rho guanine nucleotide exchange factor 40-like isoform X3 [Thamnophis sirtalis]